MNGGTASIHFSCFEIFTYLHNQAILSKAEK
jgi:hypothetical protein